MATRLTDAKKAGNHAMQRSRTCRVSRMDNQLSRPADRNRSHALHAIRFGFERFDGWRTMTIRWNARVIVDDVSHWLLVRGLAGGQRSLSGESPQAPNEHRIDLSLPENTDHSSIRATTLTRWYTSTHHGGWLLCRINSEMVRTMRFTGVALLQMDNQSTRPRDRVRYASDSMETLT